MGGLLSSPMPAATESGSVSSSSDSSSTALKRASLSRIFSKSLRTSKMVFVANTSLKMGAGKLAAQVGHATLGLYQCTRKTNSGKALLKHWEHVGAMKVVVKGQSTEQLGELYKQARQLNLHAFLVHDAGHTQIPAGSRTVLGIFGPIEDVDKVTGTLKLM